MVIIDRARKHKLENVCKLSEDEYSDVNANPGYIIDYNVRECLFFLFETIDALTR